MDVSHSSLSGVSGCLQPPDHQGSAMIFQIQLDTQKTHFEKDFWQSQKMQIM